MPLFILLKSLTSCLDHWKIWGCVCYGIIICSQLKERNGLPLPWTCQNVKQIIFFPACMLSWENVTKSSLSKNALQKNCNPFQQLATECCTFFFFFDTKYYCDSRTLFYSHTWQFSYKNKKVVKVIKHPLWHQPRVAWVSEVGLLCTSELHEEECTLTDNN